MLQCEAMNCGYYYMAVGEIVTRCHFPSDDPFPAPCEEEDNWDDSDDEMGFDPYLGCYTDDC